MIRKHPKTLLMASVLSALVLTGCSSKITSHGNQLDPYDLAKVVPGKTRLIEVEALFGRPSAEGAFDSGSIYYIGQVMEEAPGGRKETIARTIVHFKIDDRGIVDSMEITDETSGKIIYTLDARTPTPGDNFGVLDQIFRNISRGNIGG